MHMVLRTSRLKWTMFKKTLEKVIAGGGGIVGEVVHADYADGRKATFVYAKDPEGNILELQSWS